MKTLANTKISVLDLARIKESQPIKKTFENSKAVAQHVEKLGYERFWLAEHHSIDGIASAATAVLIGYIAENTKTLRVGSGGIMLPNHSPLIIAEQFGTLGTLYPGRIDLGLGRAPGSDQQTMRALRRDRTDKNEDMHDLVHELLHYFAPPKPEQKVKAIPGAGLNIPIYILGSSLYSAELAARLGRPYAFAGHFAPALMMQALQIYRTNFKPSEVLEKPYIMVGVPVIAAATDAEAKFQATSLQLTFLNLIRGERKLAVPPIDNLETLWTVREKQTVESMLGLLTHGGPEKIRRDLNLLIGQTDADEVIITSEPFEHSARLDSFGYIAQAKSLNIL